MRMGKPREQYKLPNESFVNVTRGWPWWSTETRSFQPLGTAQLSCWSDDTSRRIFRLHRQPCGRVNEPGGHSRKRQQSQVVIRPTLRSSPRCTFATVAIARRWSEGENSTTEWLVTERCGLDSSWYATVVRGADTIWRSLPPEPTSLASDKRVHHPAHRCRAECRAGCHNVEPDWVAVEFVSGTSSIGQACDQAWSSDRNVLEWTLTS